ncbi:MAG: cbb3-type cytochrome oxidase assembly protein CcoS [Pirellulaceae bacterium]|nr:cbb3-type cytochrome oxidase assembly protein CcoS [Pirellulaceae bacterium]
MSVLYVTLPIALALGALGLFACIRCIQTGQYDDLDTDAFRILQDDQPATTRSAKQAPGSVQAAQSVQQPSLKEDA